MLRTSLALAAFGSLSALLACAPPPLEEGDPPEAVRVGAPQPPAPEPPVVDETAPPVDPPVDPPGGPAIAPPPEGCPQVRVTSADGLPLRVRPGPSTQGEQLLPLGSSADVIGVVEDGEPVDGNARWFQVDAGELTGFVSGAFASCFDPSLRAPGFFLPLTCGATSTVTQGNNTEFSHNGLGAYAFDFAMPRGTPVVAVEDGVVIYSIVNSGPGDACYDGGGSGCSSGVNHVVLQHPDGTTSRYAHLNAPTVSEGSLVLRGEEVGLSGTSGWSTGPHLHMARMESDCGGPWCQSIPLSFEDGGVPVEGDVVTSGNCP